MTISIDLNCRPLIRRPITSSKWPPCWCHRICVENRWRQGGLSKSRCLDISNRSTAGMYTHTKNQFPKKAEGLLQIRDHVQEGLSKENPDLRRLFCVTRFFIFFQNSFPNNAQTKVVPAESDSSGWTLLCRDLRSFWGASFCWGICL